MSSVLIKCLEFLADHLDHLMLFRKFVSRRALGDGRAVLEGVGLDSKTINGCFNDHPVKEEEAIQAGLIKWCDGQSYKPSTWEVLIEAMEYAQLSQQDVRGLKEELGVLRMLFYIIVKYSMWQVLVYKHACICVYVDVCTCAYMEACCMGLVARGLHLCELTVGPPRFNPHTGIAVSLHPAHMICIRMCPCTAGVSLRVCTCDTVCLYRRVHALMCSWHTMYAPIILLSILGFFMTF